MLVEFTNRNKIYQCAVAAPPGPPPARVTIPFRPCPLKLPVELDLDWVMTDNVRGVELYKPARAQRRV